jgi:hypothetical protein
VTHPEGKPGMRTRSALTTGAAVIGVLLSSGLALAQPASTGDAVVDPVEAASGQGMSFTLGAGAGAAPDSSSTDAGVAPRCDHGLSRAALLGPAGPDWGFYSADAALGADDGRHRPCASAFAASDIGLQRHQE